MLNDDELFALAALLKDMSQALVDHHLRLQIVEYTIEPRLWICGNPDCGAPNTTPRFLWKWTTARYCDVCHNAQYNTPEMFEEQP